MSASGEAAARDDTSTSCEYQFESQTLYFRPSSPQKAAEEAIPSIPCERQFESQLVYFYFWPSSLQKMDEEAKVSPIGETWMDFQAPAFNLNQPGPQQPFGKWTHRQKTNQSISIYI